MKNNIKFMKISLVLFICVIYILLPLNNAFAKEPKTSTSSVKNLYNSSKVQIGYTGITSVGTGNITWTVKNSSYVLSPIINVTPLKKYNLYLKDDNGNVINTANTEITLVEANSKDIITATYKIPAGKTLEVTPLKETTKIRFFLSKKATVLKDGSNKVYKNLMFVKGRLNITNTDDTFESQLLSESKMLTNAGTLYNFNNLKNVSNSKIVDNKNLKMFSDKAKSIYGINNGTCVFEMPTKISDWDSITVVFYVPYSTYNSTSKTGGYIELFLNTLNDYNAYQYFNGNWKWGWNYLKITKADMKNPPTNIENIYFKLNARNTVATNSKFGDITFDSIIVNQRMKPTVLLNFDQIWQESIDNGGYQYMFDNNIPGTMFINDWESESSSFKSLANIMKDKYGWEMGSYGGYGDNTTIQNTTDLLVAKSNLESTKKSFINTFGTNPISYASTQFSLNPIGEEAILDVGYKMYRSLTGTPIGYFDKNSNWIYCYEISDLKFEQIKVYIDNAIKYGSSIPLFTHGIALDSGSTISSSSIPISTFKKVIDYLVELRDEGKIEILTFEQFYNACTN